MRDPVVADIEDVAESQMYDGAIRSFSPHSPLGYDYIPTFDKAGDGDIRMAFEAFIHNVGSELRLSPGRKRAGDLPDNVVGKAGENLFAIGFSKPVHVPENQVPLLCHSESYRQVIPGPHCAVNEPCAVTELVPPAGSVAVKVKVPRTSDADELVITNWPDVELNDWMVPPLV